MGDAKTPILLSAFDGHSVPTNTTGGSVMPESNALPFGEPPLPVACPVCGNKMVLESVGLGATIGIYTYQCPTGHRREVVIAPRSNKLGETA
jgi:hypothetical protein